MSPARLPTFLVPFRAPITPLFSRRCLHVTSAPTAQIQIQRATRADIREAAHLVTKVFTCEERLVRLFNRSSLGRVIVSLYETGASAELSAQLRRRIKNSGNRKHVMLIARDPQSGEMMGCVEMGLVSMPRLISEGIFSEVKQWEEKMPFGNDKKEPYLGNLSVSPSYRRQGVGSLLVREAQSYSQQTWHSEQLWLHVDGRCAKARKLYARLGFECVAREPGWYGAVGRAPRLLLRATAGMREQRSQAEWRKAKAVRGKKLGVGEYLALCVYDLRRRRLSR